MGFFIYATFVVTIVAEVGDLGKVLSQHNLKVFSGDMAAYVRRREVEMTKVSGSDFSHLF